MDKNLLDLIDKSEYISFDVFDTVIKRRGLFRPEDLFKFVERRVSRFYKKEVIKNFTDERVLAEDQAREVFKDTEEITLDQIYYGFKNNLQLDDETVKKIQEIEVQTEINFSKKDNFIFNIYNYCLEKNKKIIFLSDMYLSHDDICKILKKNHYTKFNELIISSETGFTKYTGNQYRYLLNKLNISPDKILHIGDNYQTDVNNAEKKGLSAYFYNSSTEKNAWFLNHPNTKRKINFLIKEAENKKIVFYGAGLFAQELIRQYNFSGLNVLGFVDKALDKKGQKISNYNIYQPEDIEKLNPDIIAVTVIQYDQALKFLNSFKIEKNLNFNIVYDLFQDN
ncbi:MAG: HAD-IA family hydrolase [Candidatus Gastranaerophilales bacterium]|nr:HAD-IA family hydrolase [Candidatus Gastranaerophilales bacterium]